jgi:hypothetical protein
MAVGSYSDNTTKTSGSLALAWNGTSWSLQSIALPAGATGAGFQSVSCASPTTCIGVGTAGEGTTSDALVELWNGSKWTVLAAVATVPGTYLSGVSCTSTTSCTVVGASPTGLNGVWATVAQRWNGSKWAAEQPQNAASPYASLLNQVSCHRAEACTAVGTYASDSSNDQSTLAEADSPRRFLPNRTG